jgi:hypothetical protein
MPLITTPYPILPGCFVEVRVPARRQQVAYGRERGLSARRACTLFSVARSAGAVAEVEVDRQSGAIRAERFSDRCFRRAIPTRPWPLLCPRLWGWTFVL